MWQLWWLSCFSGSKRSGSSGEDGNGKSEGQFYDPDLRPAYLEGQEAVPSKVNERKLLTKIDFRVVPILSVLYLLAFLDRTNIGNAAVFGMLKDLDLVANQYNTALTIFFVPYVIFEIPSNIILKRFKPHRWLSFCMFMFGLVTICQGLVTGYGGLLTTRFFLGLFEAGLFPGSFYLIGMW